MRKGVGIGKSTSRGYLDGRKGPTSLTVEINPNKIIALRVSKAFGRKGKYDLKLLDDVKFNIGDVFKYSEFPTWVSAQAILRFGVENKVQS